MESMAFEGRDQRSSSATSRTPAHLMFIVVIVLSIIILVLSSILVHKSYNTNLSTSDQKINLRERYPGYFRFPSEQTAFEGLPRDVKNVTSSTSLFGYNSTTQCAGPGWLPPSPVNPSFVIDNNACCTSNGSYISPDEWVDFLGIQRTLAVFTDPGTGITAKQHFYTETCQQVVGCSYNCVCGQRESHVTGVYVTEAEEYGVSWFSIPGCCKCRNF